MPKRNIAGQLPSIVLRCSRTIDLSGRTPPASMQKHGMHGQLPSQLLLCIHAADLEFERLPTSTIYKIGADGEG